MIQVFSIYAIPGQRITSFFVNYEAHSPFVYKIAIRLFRPQYFHPSLVVNGMLHGNLANTKHTVYPKKYAHGFVVLCFVVVMKSFIMNSHEVFIHIHQGGFAGTGAIVRLPQCQRSKPGGYGQISQCITTTKQKPCAYFLGYTVLISCITKVINRILTVRCKKDLLFFLVCFCNNLKDRYALELSKIPMNKYDPSNQLETQRCKLIIIHI